MGLTALDIIVVLLVGLGLVFGLMRGFVAEILSLGVWVLVILALRLLHAPLSAALVGPIGTQSGAYVLAFAIIFAAVLIGGKLVAGRISGGVRRSALGPLDRLLGAGFGALKGLVGVTLFYMAFSLVYDTIWGRDTARPEWVARAATYPLIHASADAIVNLVEARRGSAGARTGGGSPDGVAEGADDAQ